MQILWAHVNDSVPSVIGVVSRAGAEADAFFPRALAKTPDERFGTAFEMIDQASIVFGLASGPSAPPRAAPKRGSTGTVIAGDASGISEPKRAPTGTVIAGSANLPAAKAAGGNRRWLAFPVSLLLIDSLAKGFSSRGIELFRLSGTRDGNGAGCGRTRSTISTSQRLGSDLRDPSAKGTWIRLVAA